MREPPRWALRRALQPRTSQWEILGRGGAGGRSPVHTIRPSTVPWRPPPTGACPSFAPRGLPPEVQPRGPRGAPAGGRPAAYAGAAQTGGPSSALRRGVALGS